jgi:hypothetical protein
VIQEPWPKAPGSNRIERSADWVDSLEGMKEIKLEATEVALKAAEPVSVLRARRLGVDDFPGEAAGKHLRAREQGRRVSGHQHAPRIDPSPVGLPLLVPSVATVEVLPTSDSKIPPRRRAGSNGAK